MNDLFFSLDEDMPKAYGLYAMSVIKGRALPKLQDGLKPVQRRILYSMYDCGFRYNKPFKKCGRIVGDVIAKYHPHGDSSIYEALVHLAQDFVMNATLIAGKGNFGSIDGDRAAAHRYTEARLDQISEYLLQDYEKDTVPLKVNYDGTLVVPDVLPAQFPNLLVNGANGIAVGMATSIPPHNLREVMNATIAVLENEDISLEEVMTHIKGPDFPTEGEFFGGADLKKAYETGRGRVILRGVIEEEESNGKINLVITSVPYQSLKPKIIEKIVELVKEGTLEDVVDVRDESSDLIRVVIELKKYAHVDIIKQRIFALTGLQCSFSMNMVAINHDKPGTFSLLQILKEFLKFREEVVIKKAEYLLNKTLEKTHIVWGLFLATNKLDIIISTIRSSTNPQEAEKRLVELEWTKDQYSPIIEILGEGFINDDSYHFSFEQVKGILDLRLQKLTKLEKDLLLSELKDLAIFIQEQHKIVEDREYRHSLIKADFIKIRDKFGVDRKTRQLSVIDHLTEESLIEPEDCVLMLSANGYVKKVKLDEYRTQNRGGRGKVSSKQSEQDPIINLFMINTLTTILFFTSKGKVYSLKGYQIPDSSLGARGRSAVNLFGKLDADEFITTILPMDEDGTSFLFFVTAMGTVRKSKIEDFVNIRSNGKIAMKFEENDPNKLHSVMLVHDDDDVLLTSSGGRAIRFAVSDIRTMATRDSQGIRGMKLSKDEIIVGATKICSDQILSIFCITKNGFGKKSESDEYRKIKRGGNGSKAMNITAKTGHLVSAVAIEHSDELLIMSRNSQTIRFSLESIRNTKRVTSGVSLIRIDKDDYVTQVVRIKNNEDEKIEEEKVLEN